MSKQPLERRIADALNGKHPARSELAALVVEAVAAVEAARAQITAETAHAEDINNDDPDASEELVRQAERNIKRLTKAVAELRPRIQQIEAAEYAEAWRERADVIEAERDELAKELSELYPGCVERVVNLYARIDANTAGINRLHAAAPHGEWRRLVDAELKSRGLDGYNAENPPLRDNLRLPDPDRTSNISFPPPAPLNPYFEATQGAMAALNQKIALAYSPDWHEAARMRDEEERVLRAKLKEEADRKAAQEKAEYERALLRADRARRGLGD